MTATREDDCKFAITIPCFKSESTIAETLQGVLDQDEEALRRVRCIVIADDVSPDRTLEVVKSVWRRDWPPLKFESRRRNVGEMVNVNLAVAGLPPDVEWFLHMHGDNIPKPGWLRMITDRCLAAAPDVGIVCASYDIFDEHGVTRQGEEKPEAEPVVIEGNIASVRSTIRQGCWWHNSCGAVRVATYRETGGLPPGMRQKGDWDLLLRVLAAGWTIIYMPRTLMRYRLHSESASGFAFITHLDIEESLQVIQKYAVSLRASDILRTHFAYCVSLTRRFGASLYRGQFVRGLRAVAMLARTLLNCGSCLLKN